jgi:hypothetical protein
LLTNAAGRGAFVFNLIRKKEPRDCGGLGLC